MSKGGSNAGWDIGSNSHHSGRDFYERASRPRHSDGSDGSVTRYSRTDGNVSVTRKKVERGPPISMHNRYGDEEFPPRHRTRSRSGSIRAPSVVSDATVRPPKHRAHERDTDSPAFGTESYTSGRRSHTSGQYSEPRQNHKPSARRGNLYEEDRKAGLNVYPLGVKDRQSRSGGSIAPSESERTHRPSLDDDKLSRQTASLNLHPLDPTLERVAKWNEEVKHKIKENRRDGNPTTGLRSVNGEDHYREGSKAPSHHEYPQSHHSGRRSQASRPSYISPPPGSFASGFLPNDTRSQSNDLALKEYRSTHAPSSNRSHTSYNHDRYTPSETPFYTSRDSPPPRRRGTYVDGHHNVGIVDYTQMNVTNIHAPDMSFMNGPSKRQRREMRKHDFKSSRGKSRRDDSESDSD
ncbi:hypothetical protein BPOR_0218g00050 [Botrytis porri]|uniref:Uncharacterized protein n=1 Tax=Botrytis porri TaxID=87229 RepID=A0A4Z1KTH2_9HELO|nr:hypothetical protein BPOR_0218g00050 [Botrytis porri]